MDAQRRHLLILPCFLDELFLWNYFTFTEKLQRWHSLCPISSTVSILPNHGTFVNMKKMTLVHYR